MSKNSDKISLKLSFSQLLEDSTSKTKEQEFSEKEIAFLQGLDESVDFVNNYKANDPHASSLKEFLDNL